MIPPKRPTVCNLCGGRVEHVPDRKVHGIERGSGRRYRCTERGAYVGTHAPRPKEAFGLLADDRMRLGRQFCHRLFDRRRLGAPNEREERARKREWLAGRTGMPVEECRFGCFDLERLRLAYRMLREDEERMHAEIRAKAARERNGGRI